MKKSIIALAIASVALIALPAQGAGKKGADKSKFYVGGSVGFTSTTMSQNGNSVDGSSFKIMPSIGYDLKKDISVGVQLGFLTGTASFGSFDNVDYLGLASSLVGALGDLYIDDVSGFRFAPYVRYTLIGGKTFNVFVDGVLAFESIKGSADQDNDPSTDDGSKASIFELVVRPGVSLNINKNFKFVTHFGTLGYQSVSLSDYVDNNSVDGPKISRFGFEGNSGTLTLGIEYHF